MGELVFNVLQLSPAEATVGTPIAATFIYPVDTGVAFDLDRGFASPDEDYGTLSRHQSGRGSYGLRGAQASVPFVCRFEDIIRLFEQRIAGGVVPTGTGPYVWTYTLDEASVTTKTRTAELGDGTQGWQLAGCLITDLEIGFDALAAPGEHPWKATATVFALNRAPFTLTAALAAPADMETIEGHLTTLSEGDTSTVFASLAELTNSLVMYKIKISGDRPRRAYGSASDVATAYGIKKPEVTIEAQIRETATAKSNIHDIFNAAGAVAGARRWRIKAIGSGTKQLIIDHRVTFDSINLGERDGERIYAVTAHAVKDATLASSLQIAVTNSIAS